MANLTPLCFMHVLLSLEKEKTNLVLKNDKGSPLSFSLVSFFPPQEPLGLFCRSYSGLRRLPGLRGTFGLLPAAPSSGGKQRNVQPLVGDWMGLVPRIVYSRSV